MLDAKEDRLYRLERTDLQHWVIYDSAARTVADLRLANDDDVEDDIIVAWATPTPLPVHYVTPDDVLADLVRWATRQTNATKPVVIPHLAPPRQAIAPPHSRA